MANINALLSAAPRRRVLNATSYQWLLQFNCMPLSGGQFNGEEFDIELSVSIAIGDSAATVKQKIIDALQAAINQRQPGDVVTVMNTLEYARWI